MVSILKDGPVNYLQVQH